MTLLSIKTRCAFFSSRRFLTENGFPFFPPTYPGCPFIQSRTVEPNSVINDLFAGGGGGMRGQGIHQADSCGPRQFQADQPVMTGARSKEYRTAVPALVQYQFCQHILSGRAVQSGTSR